MSRKFANRFFRNHQRMLNNFMRDFDRQFESFGLKNSPLRLTQFQPLQSFINDEFFQPNEHHESPEEKQLNQQFQKEYMELKNKYEKELLKLEKKENEIEHKDNYTYNYQQFREFRDGKETGKIVETKHKMVGSQQVTEKKTTILHDDGTKEVEEEVIDEKGTTITKKKYDKNDQLLL